MSPNETSTAGTTCIEPKKKSEWWVRTFRGKKWKSGKKYNPDWVDRKLFSQPPPKFLVLLPIRRHKRINRSRHREKNIGIVAQLVEAENS